MVEAAREDMYLYEARAIQGWQQDYAGLGSVFLSVSSLGDPSQGFLLYFPIVLSLSYHRGLQFLGAFIVSEWLNMVCKWSLHGERPYWWVLETEQDVELIQTRLTCETGPGLPSGHSQAAAVIWFCVTDAVTARLGRGKLLGWILFITMQVLMFFSRTFIAAHFPHQCIFGCLTGLAVVRVVYLCPSWLELSRLQLVLLSVCLTAYSLTVFFVLRFIGYDPNWSILLAKKHCQSPDWIYVDTTPFYAMVRFSGSALGLALSCDLPPPGHAAPLPRQSLAALLATVSLGQLCRTLHAWIPRDHLSQFYILEFFLNFFSVTSILRTTQILLRAPRTPKETDRDGLKVS